MRAPAAQGQAGDRQSPELTSAAQVSSVKPAGVGDARAPAPASTAMSQAGMPATVSRDAVEARLRAYIRPRRIQTPEQQEAFDAAVDAQYSYECGEAAIELPRCVSSLTVGSYSIRRAGSADMQGPPSGICQEALAYLCNAGLLKREWPIAKPI